MSVDFDQSELTITVRQRFYLYTESKTANLKPSHLRHYLLLTLCSLLFIGNQYFKNKITIQQAI